MKTLNNFPKLAGTFLAWFVILLICGGFYGCPKYHVWQQGLEGQAELERAKQNRNIQIEEAMANLESQKLNAEAEIIRAKGMAESISYENGKLTDRYIQYLWVRNIEKMQGEKIYIPTEGNLPLLEARSKINMENYKVIK